MKNNAPSIAQMAKRINKINTRLQEKGFDWKEITAFWERMFRLNAKVESTGLENIKICTGCGHLNIEPIEPPHLACCPDNSYVNIDQQEKAWRVIPKEEIERSRSSAYDYEI